MRNRVLINRVAGFGLVLFLAGCALKPTQQATLYDRLGGDEGVTAIVDNLLYELAGNEKLIGFFEETDINRFRTKLIEQLCEVSDGPCRYSGDSMAKAHSNMTLNRSHFDSLVNDLIAAMNATDTPVAAQNDLLARLVPMYDEVMHPQKYLSDADQ
ncbi:MAG: group 1 truncated hemoglobin [Reinekea sp.]|nr:group 1 truncated hemoglobin [Reinekea sp.]